MNFAGEKYPLRFAFIPSPNGSKVPKFDLFSEQVLTALS